MLKVGYDAQALLSPNGGLGKGLQLRNLLGCHIDTFFGFASPAPNHSGLPLIQEGVRKHRVWQQLSLPRSLRRHKIQLFLAPENTAPYLLPSSVRLILVLHDTIALRGFRHRNIKARIMANYLRRQIPASVSRAEVVLTVSEYSRAEILDRFPKANVKVIPCTVAEEWFQPVSFESRENYLLLITSPAPHKNAAGALAGYAQYASQAGASAAPLRIIGLSHNAEQYRALANKLGVDHLVTCLPYLTETELQAQYRRAAAAIVPSFVEGFGIPLLEAMATGTPVLTSNISSLPEVGGNAPCYFDPAKPEEIGGALTTVMNDPSLRRDMASAGLKRAQHFHPVSVAHNVEAFWREMQAS